MSRYIIFTIYFNMAELTKLLSTQFIESCLANPLQNQKCHQMHGSTCNHKAYSQFVMGCKGVYKMYLVVHLIPLILKRKKIAKQPLTHLKKTIIGFIKSLLFAGGYSALVRRSICFLTQHWSYNSSIAFISGFVGGLTLLFQPVGRQMQIAMYTLNKSMQVGYNMAVRRGYPVKLPYGQGILNGVALAILCFVYMFDSQLFRQNYRKILDRMLKDV